MAPYWWNHLLSLLVTLLTTYFWHWAAEPTLALHQTQVVPGNGRAILVCARQSMCSVAWTRQWMYMHWQMMYIHTCLCGLWWASWENANRNLFTFAIDLLDDLFDLLLQFIGTYTLPTSTVNLSGKGLFLAWRLLDIVWIPGWFCDNNKSQEDRNVVLNALW